MIYLASFKFFCYTPSQFLKLSIHFFSNYLTLNLYLSVILHKLTYEIQFSNRRSFLLLKRNKVNEINDFKPPTNHSSSNISVENCIELKNEDGYSHDFSYLFPPRSMSRKRAQKNVDGINFNFIYIFQTGNMFFHLLMNSFSFTYALAFYYVFLQNGTSTIYKKRR